MSRTKKTRRLSLAAALALAEKNGDFADAPAAAEAAPVETPKVKKEKTPKWEALPADRIEWIRENARPAIAPCLCGCGGTTKGRFMPGHDATLKATLEAHADEATLAAFGWA